MAKFDAEERQAARRAGARGDPAAALRADREATETGEVARHLRGRRDAEAALDDLTPEFVAKAQQADNPQLAIEALRKLLAEESAKVTRHNLIRQRAVLRAASPS